MQLNEVLISSHPQLKLYHIIQQSFILNIHLKLSRLTDIL